MKRILLLLILVWLGFAIYREYVDFQKSSDNMASKDKGNVNNGSVSQVDIAEIPLIPKNPIFLRLRELLPRPTDAIFSSNDQGKTFTDEEIHWLADHYAFNAVKVVERSGTLGAVALQTLGLKGLILLKDRNDKRFEQMIEHLSVRASATLLFFLFDQWEELDEHEGFEHFLCSVEKLSEKAKQYGEQNPLWFPYLVSAENEVVAALDVDYPDYTVWNHCFSLIDLSKGADDLIKISEWITLYLKDESKKHFVKQWVQQRGLDGLLLAHQFPELLLSSEKIRIMTSMDLSIFLGILSCNQVDIRTILDHNPSVEALLQSFQRLAVSDNLLPIPENPPESDSEQEITIPSYPVRNDLLNLATSNEHTIRFVYEKKDAAVTMITKYWEITSQIGLSIPQLLYGYYDQPDKPYLLENAYLALVNTPYPNAPFAEDRPDDNLAFTVYCCLMNLRQDNHSHPMLDNLAPRFNYCLNRIDYRVVPFVIEGGLDNDKKIRELEDSIKTNHATIKLDEWQKSIPIAKQVIPGYDACRLAWLLSQGTTPSTGDMVFAGLDTLSFLPIIKTVTVGGKATTIGGKGLTTVVKKATGKMIVATGKNIEQATVEKALKKEVSNQVFGNPDFLRYLAKDSHASTIKFQTVLVEKSAKAVKLSLPITKNLAKDWAMSYSLVTGIEIFIKAYSSSVKYNNGVFSLSENITENEDFKAARTFLKDKINEYLILD